MTTALVGIFLEPHRVYGTSRSKRCSYTNLQSRSISQVGKSVLKVPKTSSGTDNAGCETSSSSLITPTMTNTENDPTLHLPHNNNVAVAMFTASGRSLGQFFTSYTQGFLVDLPLGAAEGFRSLPALWGDPISDYGNVTDWRSGFVVAGKSLSMGVPAGLRDLNKLPAQGWEQDCAWGAAKGVARGAVSFLSKTMSATIGMVAYPGQGLSKSLHSLINSRTMKAIMGHRRAEGQWLLEAITKKRRDLARTTYWDLVAGDDLALLAPARSMIESVESRPYFSGFDNAFRK